MTFHVVRVRCSARDDIASGRLRTQAATEPYCAQAVQRGEMLERASLSKGSPFPTKLNYAWARNIREFACRHLILEKA
jgi:hypothetical protein